MRVFSKQPLIDITGVWVSALCAVHCAVLPIVLSISAFGGFVFLENPKLEIVILVASAMVGIISLVPSYFRHHRRFSAIGILVLGFVLIGLGRVSTNSVTESVLTSIGAVTIAIAHLSNIRLCRSRYQSDYKG